MRRKRLLIIGHDHEALRGVSATLLPEGCQVATATTCEEGIARACEVRPDLILLDADPGPPGSVEVCRCLRGRSRTCRAAIVLMAPLDSEWEPEILAGLENGADDYLLTPVATGPFLTRCRIALERRRDGLDPEPVVQVGEILVDPNAFEARVEGKRLELTPTEFRLLYVLARRPGWVLSRDQIVDAVRGADCVVGTRTVDGQVLSLRRKLGPYGGYVETVRGAGYRFQVWHSEEQ